MSENITINKLSTTKIKILKDQQKAWQHHKSTGFIMCIPGCNDAFSIHPLKSSDEPQKRTNYEDQTEWTWGNSTYCINIFKRLKTRFIIMGLKNTCHHGKGVEQPMTACSSIYKQTKPPCLMQKSILHCTSGSILYVWVQCMPSCREELNFTFLFFENVSTEGQICFSMVNVKKCRVKQFERGSKLQIHITQPFMCTMPTKKCRCDATALKCHRTKHSCWPTAWACYMIVQTPVCAFGIFFFFFKCSSSFSDSHE